jgi:hypothetical protein
MMLPLRREDVVERVRVGAAVAARVQNVARPGKCELSRHALTIDANAFSRPGDGSTRIKARYHVQFG